MHNRIITILIGSLAMLVAMGACRRADNAMETEDADTEQILVVENDSMVYGLACDGTSDSVIVLWPFSGDPITFSCIDATQDGRVFGKPDVGDWTGVMVNPEDSTEAAMVVNLDMLKATWTYPVMPVMKDLQNMSKRAQRRMMANMPDSLKEALLVPREYGFTLKRSHKAQPVGMMMGGGTLEDDSPVLYPEVKGYREWHTCNGRLLLVSSRRHLPGDTSAVARIVVDTLDFVYMNRDSLILRMGGADYHYHRRQAAPKADEMAVTAAGEQAGK